MLSFIKRTSRTVTYQSWEQGWTVFAWNFVQFPANAVMRGALLWLTGFIDFTFALILTIACANIASFLPRSIAGCGRAAHWRNTPDGRNLFVELVDAPDDVAGSTCKDMVTLWIVAVVVM